MKTQEMQSRRAEHLANGEIMPDDLPMQAAEIEPRETEWVVPGWIPAGRISLLSGETRIGKSLIALDIAARISNGSPVPFNTARRDPAAVIVFSAHDSLSETIRPRLEAAGGNTSLIHLFPGGGKDKLSDAPLMNALIHKLQPALVIVDPVSAYNSARTDGSHPSLLITHLAEIAESTGAAFLIVSAENRITGAGRPRLQNRALAAQARSIITIAWDAQPENRLMLHTKNILAKPAQTLRSKVKTNGCSPAVDWLEVAEFVNAETAYACEPGEQTSLTLARRFLFKSLAHGRIEAVALVALAQQQGISERTLQRARNYITTSIKTGSWESSGPWVVELNEYGRQQAALIAKKINIGALRHTWRPSDPIRTI